MTFLQKIISLELKDYLSKITSDQDFLTRVKKIFTNKKNMSINNTILKTRIGKRIIPFLDTVLREKYNIKNDYSFGLIVYFLMQKFDLSLNEAISCVTDGSNDKGIDAVYIDDNLGEISIIQSEYKQNIKNVALGENKIRLTLNSIFDIFDGKISKNNTNPFLASKIQNIIDLATDNEGAIKTNIYFITNTEFPNNKLDNAEYRQSVGENRNYGVYWYDLLHILSLESESDQIFTTNIRIKADQYTQATDIGNIRGIVATISSSDLIKVYKDGGFDNVFQSNIRNYLGSKSINKKIYDTAINPIESKYFWFFNNGISLICNKYIITDSIPGQKNIEIINPQIINGGQTTKTLVNLENDIKNSLFPDEVANIFRNIKLLVRIYETEDINLIKQITIGTNTQNAISKQDLQANNETSQKVQSYFEEFSYGLEIKKNEYNTGSKKDLRKSLKYIATQDEVLQFYVSIFKERPHSAYISKTKAFEDYFKLIFSENNKNLDNLPLEYFRAFEIGYFIQNKIKSEDVSNGNSFLANSSIFLMYVIAQLEPNLKDVSKKVESFNLDKIYNEAKEITKSLVEKRREKEEYLYSNNKYFKTEECKKDFLIWQKFDKSNIFSKN